MPVYQFGRVARLSASLTRDVSNNMCTACHGRLYRIYWRVPLHAKRGYKWTPLGWVCVECSAVYTEE